MLKATAAIYVSIDKEVIIASVPMDSKCYKTTRLVNVRKVFRSRITGPFVWVILPLVSHFGFISTGNHMISSAIWNKYA